MFATNPLRSSVAPLVAVSPSSAPLRSPPPPLSAASSIDGSTRRLAVKAACFGDESFDQRSRFPVITESLTVLVHPREDRRQPDGVRIEHRSAAIARKAEPVAVDHIDVP